MARSCLELAEERVRRFRTAELRDKPRCLAVIPARGGSERIEHKNIVDFFGKPILSYTLAALSASALFEEVHVSTDCDRIARVASDLGFAPPFLREAYADSESGVWQVVRWVVERYRDRGEHFAVVCLASACMPLLEAEDLRGGLAYFLSESPPRPVMACCEYLSSPERGLRLARDGSLRPKWGDKFFESQSQRLEVLLMDTGAFAYRSSSDVLAFTPGDHGQALGRAYVLDREKGVDINTAQDLAFAKLLFRARFPERVATGV